MSIGFFTHQALRILDAGLATPEHIARRWTGRKYLEYLLAWDTKETREAREEAARRAANRGARRPGRPKKKEWRRMAPGRPNSREVPYAARDKAYYVKVATRLALQYLLYNALEWYIVHYPPKRDVAPRAFLNFTDVKSIMDNLVYGLMVYTTLCLVYTPSFLLVSHIYKTSFQPLMRSPFLATSPRDFWSNRWNAAVKVLLKLELVNPGLAF
ncbi:hypothetical protein HK104_009703 [Borealophlyctis nickersoniae]|nr:hypothetical protein HK104_009703 [Borealophlyctis nickersoniae]